MTEELRWKIKSQISEIEGHIIDAQVELKDAKQHLMDAMTLTTHVLALLEKEEEE